MRASIAARAAPAGPRLTTLWTPRQGRRARAPGPRSWHSRPAYAKCAAVEARSVSEVFISYSHAAQAEAEAVSAALRAAGYEVWRDDLLPPHRPYADVIEERLRAAKAVLVLWSAEAVKSQWVRAEAE